MLSKKIRGREQEKRKRGIIFVVSAPSGAGKTTLCKMAVDFFPFLRHSISYTTRPPRDGEINGVDYRFVSTETFDRMIKKGEFIEWAEVHGCRYGTSSKDLNAIVAKGLDVILDIDVKGARQIKDSERDYDSLKVFIFILPPSIEVCEQRLKCRGKDNNEIIEKRIKNAKKEIKESVWYDYIIINDNLDIAFEKVKSVIIAEKSKRERMLDGVKGLFKQKFHMGG